MISTCRRTKKAEDTGERSTFSCKVSMPPLAGVFFADDAVTYLVLLLAAHGTSGLRFDLSTKLTDC